MHGKIPSEEILGSFCDVVRMTATVSANATGFGLSMPVTRTNREHP